MEQAALNTRELLLVFSHGMVYTGLAGALRQAEGPDAVHRTHPSSPIVIN